jgi:hypothetical protein
MYKRGFLIGLLLSVALNASTEPVDARKTAFVGHSLINQNITMMVKQIAESLGKQHDQAIQLMNGAPLRWNFDRCNEVNFTGKWPPRSFICDELEGKSEPPFDSLVVAEANNPIRGHYTFNKTDVYVEAFMRKLKAHNANADMYLYTSWEGIKYHGGDDEWLAAIEGETAHFEQMAQKAEAHALKNGYKANVNVIPMSLALKILINAIESGLVEGLSTRKDIFKDNVHLNPTGSYFAASVLYAFLYKQSPEGASGDMKTQWGKSYVSIPKVQRKQLHALAWKVAQDYTSR